MKFLILGLLLKEEFDLVCLFIHSIALILVTISLLHVSNTENEGEEHAESSYGYVADGEEIVSASESVSSRNDE